MSGYQIERLPTSRVFGLLERNMRKAPRWNAPMRADSIFEETGRNFLELLSAECVAIYLDDPITKLSQRPRQIELVCVTTATRRPKKKIVLNKKTTVGDRISAQEGPLGLCYRSARVLQGGAQWYLPIVMGQGAAAAVGVVEVTFPSISSVKERKNELRLAQTLCRYFSAALQNVLDAQKRLEMERRDALTGLANGSELELFLKKVSKKPTALAVIFMDLDFFKKVNDTWGHLVGSELLGDVGEALRQTLAPLQKLKNQQDGKRAKSELGKIDYLAARYGGDEFVIALAGLTLADAQNLAETIRLRIASKKGLCRAVTASLGLAWSAGNVRRKRDYRALIKAADEAMYEAKRWGRNRLVVSGGLRMAEKSKWFEQN